MTPLARPLRLSRRARLGVSLIEVLFAIGILTVGLLGVASVIPLGGREVAEAGKADRMAACGQAVLHDVKVRGFLDPRGWRSQAGVPIVRDTSGGTVTSIVLGDSYLLPRGTYVIDPQYVAYANSQGISNAHLFPYGTTPPNLGRVTLARSLTSNVVLSFAEAEQLCTWRDDLSFDLPDESDDRPRASVLADMGSNKTDLIRWPVRTSDNVPGTPTALKAHNEGQFSWLLTVTPSGRFTKIGTIEYVQVDHAISYQVSVVVFFNRNLGSVNDPDLAERGERAIGSVDFTAVGTGFGGGDVELTSAPTGELRKNHWLLIPFDRSSSSPTQYAWYRVVAVDEWDSTASTRYVTLSGPDWTFGYSPVNNVAWLPEAIGVFSATIPSETRD